MAKILVVDDNSKCRKNLTTYLKLNGYEVAQAHDGREAIRKCDNERFDLVLTDIIMPGIDGFMLTAHTIKNFPSIPVVLMTGDPPNDPQRVTAMTGARGLLTKPLILNQVLAKIKEILV